MAQTLKQRGLAVQSYGVQNAGTPGDFTAVDQGSWTRRPYGPSLAGWTHGWSAHNSNNNAGARANWTIGGGSGPDTKALLCGWFFFGPGTVAAGNGKIYNQFLFTGAGDVQGLQMHVSTMALDLVSAGSVFTAQTGIKTVPRNTWVWLAVASENTSANNWTIKALYKEIGQAIQTLATVSFTNAQTYTAAYVGTQTQSGSYIAARMGLPSLYQIGSVAADAIYPTEIIEPSLSRQAWYVRSDGAGSGEGVTNTPTGAWSPADFMTEMAAGSFTVMSGAIVDAGGTTVDTTAIDADTLRGRYGAGTARHNGDIIYFNDSGGPIRLNAGVAFTISDAVELTADPALGRTVEIRGTTRLASGSWTNISGANYKQSITCSNAVVFEFADQATADSRTGKALTLAHPGGVTSAAGFAAASTDGSFGTDGGHGGGTEVYLRATGSGNPASNGKVYETTTGGNADLITATCTHSLIHNLNIRYTAAVNTNNVTGEASGTALGSGITIGGPGLHVVDSNNLERCGNHAIKVHDNAGNTNKLRFIGINNTMNDCIPALFGGTGGQTMTVEDGTTNGLDNQWYWENNTCVTNAAAVGSTTGTVDVSQTTMYEHTGSGAHPFSKGWALSNNMAGPANIGGVTSTTVIRNNTMGAASAQNAFGGTTLTVSQNTITGMGLGQIGEASGTANVRNNIFIASGAITVTPTWVGTVNFLGNTIDATLASGGTTKALANRGGVVVLTFSANILLFNNADAYRVLDTITPASGDSLTMQYNELRGTDSTRILVTAYAGANTKTLAQLVAGGQDVGSAYTTDMKIDATTYRITNESPARNFVPLATVTGLSGTSDRLNRPRSGSTAAGINTDAGAIQYLPLRRGRILYVQDDRLTRRQMRLLGAR